MIQFKERIKEEYKGGGFDLVELRSILAYEDGCAGCQQRPYASRKPVVISRIALK